MTRRKLLIGVSIAGHAALFAGVFVSNVWDLEQLDHESRPRLALGIMTPPVATSAAVTGAKVELAPKPTVVVKEPRQPRPTRPPSPAAQAATPGSGTDSPAVGDIDGPPGADPCLLPDGCAPPPARPAPEPHKDPQTRRIQDVPPPPPRIIVLEGLRVRGETAIHPPRDVFQEMHRNGDLKTSAAIKLCLAADGTVASVTMMKSTRYAAYDEAIQAAARRWIYRPYTVNGTPVPACGMVTFVYEMR